MSRLRLDLMEAICDGCCTVKKVLQTTVQGNFGAQIKISLCLECTALIDDAKKTLTLASFGYMEFDRP